MSRPPVKTAASKALSPRKPAATKRPRKASAEASTQVEAEASAPPVPARASKNILSAGIKALTSAHEEAVARQSRVFESLLGLGPRRETAEKASAPLAATTLDPFGFKKFEDVFDQRVARAMEHLGVPTAEAFAALEAEVERLREVVARLEAQARKR
jgi:Poly(hydroxyalcanoate) granule associated protein (phasin)